MNLLQQNNSSEEEEKKTISVNVTMKEKIRRLSSVNSIQQSKTEFSDDCNVVDHTSVPRKLRSDFTSCASTRTPSLVIAMKKRSHESISLETMKPKDSHTGEKKSHKKDGAKKPRVISQYPCSNIHRTKKRGSDWCKKGTVSGPITKDEEEVVETLYALAGMFSNGDSMEVKSSTPPETMESPVTVLEVNKEDTNTVQAAETVPLSTANESSNETVPSSTQDENDLPDSKKVYLELDSTISERRLNKAILSLAKSEPDPEDSSCTRGDFHIFSEPSLETGLKQPKQHVTNPFETKSETKFVLTTVETQIAQQHMTREPRKNGLTLWPGLSPAVPLGPQSTSSQSVTNTIPTWLDAANYCPWTCSLEASSSTEKVLEITRGRNAMKKSTTHVYISRLILNLQMQDNKDGILQKPLWLKPHVGLKQTDPLYPKNSNNSKHGMYGNVSGSTPGNTATGRNTYEDRRGNFTHQRVLHQEQPRAASAYRMNTSQRQSFDFLSLSIGGVSMEANNSCNEVCNAIESMSQLQVPYLHSVPQHQSLLPFSVPPTLFASSACTDHLSTATATQQTHLQLPQYLSNPFRGPYTSHSGSTKQQQQQRLWAAHRAAQYRNHGTSASMTHFSSRQNGKHESSTLMPGAQTVVPIQSTLDDVKRKCLYFV